VLAGRDRPIYVILMSANIDRSRLGEALDSGADDFISKPPVADELYARLRAAERFAMMQRELVRLACVDALTGLHNRRSFFEHAESARMRCDDGHPLSVIMFDIDHFKRVNDVYGHDVGDQVIAAAARAAGRECALTGRLGGEEFAIVLEGYRTAGAVELAERLRAEIAALCFDTPLGVMSVTCSFGVSEQHDDETIAALLKRADIALYAAKSGGRNRVVAADMIQTGTHTVRAIAR
jgi:diguanylate cyclase (GGDEF)-like protein